ncbi:MAG: B12-binding domain-containing radical SAM protein [bacterium]|nr:B12-binding domain-containing radical SAM protein [bacterium]
MKIAFVAMGPGSPLSIGILSSIVKQHGHEVKLFYDPSLFNDGHIFESPRLGTIFNIRKNIIADIVAYEPRLIAFSVMTNTYRWALEMADTIKSLIDTPIIFGGIHPTSVPEIVIQEKSVDMINIGEGVESFPELVNLMAAGKDYFSVKNTWFKHADGIIKNPIRPFIKNLDELPFTDMELFKGHIDIKRNYKIMASRGCPYNCTFCCTSIYRKLYRGKGKYLRWRSPGNVINELLRAKECYSIKSVNFFDDVFTTDKNWLNEFLSLYNEQVQLPYMIISHVRYMDDEIVKKLKDTGCIRVELGIQSVNEEVRKKILKRPETNEEIKRALLLCEKYQLPYQVNHIFGFPGEGREQQVEAARFYANYKPARISTFWLVYFPKTEIVAIARKMNILSREEINEFENGYMSPYHYEKNKDSSVSYERKLYLLFLLIPLLPRKITARLINSKTFFKLSGVSYFLKLFLELLNAFKYRDYNRINFFYRYSRYIVIIIVKKVKNLLKKMFLAP